jgi:membrane fusion protein (multidrug efflux system)
MFRHLAIVGRPPRPPRRASVRPAVASLAAVAVSVALSGCHSSGPAGTGASGRTAAVVDVATAPARYVPVTRLLRVTGSLIANEEAEVAAETAGRVVQTPVERGTKVPEGAPLIRLSPTEAEASLKEAEANVAQIEVRLGISGDQQFDVESVAEVSNARAAKELAAAEFKRIEKLYGEHVVSGSEFDQRRTQMEVSSRQYDTARNNARQMFRQLDAARARLVLARKAVDDTVVRSPFDGLVVERKVSTGDFVTRGLKVATVVKIHPLRVELTVPEQSVSAVRAGQSLDLEVDAYPGRTFRGQVRYVSPALSPDQRALTVEAVLPNPDGMLKPGLFVTAQIEQPGEDRALVVPSSAIRDIAGSRRVYVVRGDHVEERMVTVGQVVGSSTEITNGVVEGDQVAHTNVERLADGVKVRATTAGAATGQVAPLRGAAADSGSGEPTPAKRKE